MLSVKLVFVLIACGALHVARAVDNKLNVLILYESLCPDSIRFMRDQLGPNYESLKHLIDITLVPFGKSQSADYGARFFCQHGPAECEGNRMQSCVLQQTTDQEAQVNFAVCQMTSHYKSSVQYCAESAGLSGDIDECLDSDLGTSLQLEAEKITQLYQPTFVPTIIYNGKFDQELQDSSLQNFKEVVCSFFRKSSEESLESVC